MPVFLFTDIEGSTGLWEQHSQAMGPALARHDQILQELIAQYDGRILRHRGDGLSVVFEQGEPLACVIAAQKQLAAESWGEIGELRVCMALHAGEAERREFTSKTIGQKEEYFGSVLNRTARILVAGSGGQILLTPEVVEICGLPSGASLQDLGKHLLKSLDTPQQIYGLTHSDFSLRSFPPLRTLARVDTPLPPCPYRGLFAFREADAPYFFGREKFTERLVDAIHQQKAVALIGPSGSGKSSVVFAGLIPRLRQGGGWLIIEFRPSSNPFYSLAVGLVPLLEPDLTKDEQFAEAKQLAGALEERTVDFGQIIFQLFDDTPTRFKHLLLVADQFEELYTLCPQPKMRFRFLDMLLSFTKIMAERDQPDGKLVLTLRADFMSQALFHRPFANALQDATVLLGPMTRDELRQAIEKPASQLGVMFEAGLVTRILDDIGDEPGNLPLLEFALTLLWERQIEGQLTHAAYEAVGQVEGALAHYADTVYEDLSPVEQERARWVFLQMIHPGEGTEDTRRVATYTELGTSDWEMIRHLADARLVVTDRDPAGQETVEVVHEALIKGWGRLREWMSADRAFRTWQERLRVAMRQWEASGRDEGALLRGVLLAEAEEWTQVRPGALSPQERQFLQTSIKLRDQELLLAEAQRQRELAQAQALAEAEHQRAEVQARASKRLRILAVGLMIMFFLAIGAAFFAFNQQQEASYQAATAETARDIAEREQVRAEQQARLALSRQLAAQAVSHLTDQPDLAILLNLEASRLTDPAETDHDLALELKLNPSLVAFLHGHTDFVTNVTFSPDGRMLASSSDDDTIILWDLAALQPIGPPLTGHTDYVKDVAFSPDGQMLASAARDHTVRLWDVATGEPIGLPLEQHHDQVNAVAFSPDGQKLVSASSDGTIMLWDIREFQSSDVATGHPIGSPLTGHTAEANAVVFSPDGQVLASASNDGTIRLWEVMTGRAIDPPLAGHSGYVNRLAFSPDGQMLASGSDDHSIILWDVATGQPIGSPLTGHTHKINSVAFSPDGQVLASGSDDHTIILWDVATGQPKSPPLAVHPDSLLSVAFSPDGQMLASSSTNNTLVLWDVSASQFLSGHTEWVGSVAFSPDGQILASGSDDDTIMLWNVTTGQLIGSPLVGHTDDVLGVAFSPDGKTLASAGSDQTVRLWEVATGQPLGSPLAGHTDFVTHVAFSPDGGTMASGSGDHTIIFWDVATSQPIGSPLAAHTDFVSSVAFSPDGQILASGSADQTIILWDVATGQPIGSPLLGHTDRVWDVAFSPDGQLLASVGDDKTVRLWDVREPRSNDVTTGEAVRAPLTGHTDQVWGVAFSPDGKILASSSRDNTVILWDVATGQPLGPPLIGHTNWVWGLEFSPDGKILASGGRDAKIILWQVEDELWSSRACRIANRNLTEAEWQQFFGETPYDETCPNLPPSLSLE